MSNYIHFEKDDERIVEGPFDDFQLQTRYEELLAEGVLHLTISSKKDLEDDRFECINDIGFTD
jgi:hypothetical protein